MANTSIKFRDSDNWEQVDGVIIDQTNLSIFFKDTRPQPSYIPPEIITGVWNGKSHDIQHIRHDIWELEFIGRESELQKLATMQSCDIIIIEDINNGLLHTVDMQVSEWLSFTEPERIADTTNWKLVIRYRTNKTIINKFKGLSNQVVLVGGDGTYNSKYVKIPYKGEIEKITTIWDATELTIQEINNVGFDVLLYLNSVDLELFKNDWNQNAFTIDAVTIIDKLLLQINQLGEDNYQVIITGITVKNVVSKFSLLPNLVTVVADALTVYSQYDKLILINEATNITTEWMDGSDRLLQEINKTGVQVLLFMNNTDLGVFQSRYNSVAITVDGVAVIEKLPLEITQLGEDNYQIILSCITTSKVHSLDFSPLNTHALIITDVGGPYTYNTDYNTSINTPDADKKSFDNEDGLPVDSKIISTQVTDIKLFLDKLDMKNLKYHYEKGSAATIDAVPILYRGIVKTTEIHRGVWEVNIEGLTTTPLVTYPL